MASPKKSNSTVKKNEVDTQKAAVVKDVASKFTQQDVIKSVGVLQLTMTNGLNDVTKQILEKITERDTLDTAIKLKKEELEQIHGVGAALKDIDELSVQFETKKLELDKGFEEYERQIETNKAEATFEFEQQQRDADVAFQTEQRQKQLEADDKFRLLELGWKEREDNLKKQETEVATLKQQAAEAPAKFEAELKKQVAIAENSVKRELTHQLDLVKKDAEAAQKIATNTIASQELTITDLKAQVTALQARVNTAEASVASIAKEALTSASGQGALAAVQQTLANKESSLPRKQ